MPTFHGTTAQIKAANQRYAANQRAANQRRAANQAKSAGNSATAPVSSGSVNSVESQSLSAPPSYQPALDALASAQGSLAQKQVVAKQSPTEANLAAVKALQNRVKTDASTVAARKATASSTHTHVTNPSAPVTTYQTPTTLATAPVHGPDPLMPATPGTGPYYMGNTPTPTGVGTSTGQSIYSIDPNTGQTYAADAAALSSYGSGATSPTSTPATTSSLTSSPYVKYALIAGLIGGGAWLYLRSKNQKKGTVTA